MKENLVPSFILQQLADGKTNGRFPAVGLFVDIHGFTPLTSALMQHGKAGAEQIADALATVFDPLVQIVYQQGGFVAGFAGDSFKAVFSVPPETGYPLEGVGAVFRQTIRRAVSAAWQIRTQMAQQASYRTPFGTFEFDVKVTVADGEVEWGIWQTAITLDNAFDQESAYYFDGDALDHCLVLDNFAEAGDVLLSDSVHGALPSAQIQAEAGDGYWRLRQMSRPNQRRSRMETAVSLPISIQNLADHFYPAALMPDLRGEFRQIVTLFINVKTLPNLTADDPFPTLFFNLLDKYGGYLCRIGRIGGQDDGATLLLFWGAPNSYEDDALRAVRFATALKNTTSTPLRMGMTLNLAYAGFMGTKRRDEYTCHSIYVNLAARQMTLGDWGHILLDEEIADAADEQFDVIHKGDFQLKGFSKKRPIYQLKGQQMQTAVSIYQGKLIGREAQLTQLQQAIQPIFNAKFGGIITVLGDAGIGKSRFIHDFINGKQSGNRQSLLCHTDAILKRPLNPFRYMLHAVFNQTSKQSDAENKRRFEEKIKLLMQGRVGSGEQGRNFHPTASASLHQEVGRTANFLAALLNPQWADALYEQLEPKLRFDNTLAALKSLLLLLCKQQPLILHIEDAQWLDNDSITFLNRLMRNIETVPLAIILATRKSLSKNLLPPNASFPQTTITLSPLPKDEICRLAEAFLQQPISTQLCQHLQTRTDGNPLFIEQLLLHWQENKALLTSTSGLTLSKAAHAMPFDVRTLLIARLDRLPQSVREVVQTAAVLGREFERPTLAQMLRHDSQLDQKIAAAERALIWTAVNDHTIRFNQALLREAAYEIQLQSRLRRLHFEAAEAIMALHATDLTSYYDDMAFHYDRAETAVQAAMWYKLAGKQAMRQYANKQAEAMFSRALTLTPSTNQQQQFKLLLNQEQLYHIQGRREQQAAILSQLESVTDALADDSRHALKRQATVALRHSVYAETMSDHETAVTHAETAVRLAEIYQDIPQLAEAYLQWGKTFWSQSQYETANDKLNQALSLATQANMRQTEASALRYLGVVADFQGNYSQARQYHEQALRLFQTLNHQEGISGTLNNLGMTALKQGHYAAARQNLERALKNHRTIGHRSGESWALANLGFVSSLQGDYTNANRHYQQALLIFREVGDVWSQAMAVGHLGLTAENRGKYTLALKNHAKSRALFKQVGYEQGEGMALAAIGSVQRRLGNLGEAETAVNAAMALNQKFKAQRGLAQNLTSLSLLAHLANDNRKAVSYAEEALHIAQEMGERHIQAYALTNLAHAQAALGQLDKASTHYHDALALRHTLGNPVLAMDARAGLARLLLEQDDLSAANEQVALILTFLGGNHLGGADEPKRIYLTCVQVLQAMGDPAAHTVLTAGQQFLAELAANIENEADREAFLHDNSGLGNKRILYPFIS